MIVAVVADLHLTERKGDSYATLDEQVEICDWIGRDAAAHDAEVMLCGGDVFDGASTPAERNAAIEIFSDWAQRMPVIVAYGNHDRPGDLDFLGKLRTKHGIHVHSRPVSDIVVGAGGRELDFAVLPWPRKAWLAAKLNGDQDVELAAIAAMTAILHGLGATWSRDLPRVLVAHAELGNALADSGQPMVGKCDIELSATALLESDADAICLGHIHKHQLVGDRIVYAGGIRQTTFGEDAKKGYCLIDVDRGRPPVVTHRQGPGRELVTIEGEWVDMTTTPDGADMIAVNEFDWGIHPVTLPPGASVRLVYEIDEESRVQAASAATTKQQALLGEGAHAVKVDARVVPTHRVRSEKIREARSTADKLEALWASQKRRPARSDALLAKLVTLEAEVAT